jgi:hypothetical protein
VDDNGVGRHMCRYLSSSLSVIFTSRTAETPQSRFTFQSEGSGETGLAAIQMEGHGRRHYR